MTASSASLLLVLRLRLRMNSPYFVCYCIIILWSSAGKSVCMLMCARHIWSLAAFAFNFIIGFPSFIGLVNYWPFFNLHSKMVFYIAVWTRSKQICSQWLWILLVVLQNYWKIYHFSDDLEFLSAISSNYADNNIHSLFQWNVRWLDSESNNETIYELHYWIK